MAIHRRQVDPAVDLRRLQDLSHRVWRHDPSLLNFETSFGTLAWECGGAGRARLFERDGHLVGWARLVPGYSRIRQHGVRDEAPPSLVWQVDMTVTDPLDVLDALLGWAESRTDARFTTSHTEADNDSARFLTGQGYRPDPTEPFSLYLQQPLHDVNESVLDGYGFTTMSGAGDLEARAEVHRLAWDGSTRSPQEVRSTMATWPYRSDLDVLAIADDGSLVASAIAWYDESYAYGEFEPVGTVPSHRGKGVGAALLRFGLCRLRQAGASYAVVGARGDDDYPAPRRLYRSVGFDVVSRQVVVRRTLSELDPERALIAG